MKLEACTGQPFNQDTGRKMACPLRDDCRRYERKYDKAARNLDAAPFDFDTHSCELQVTRTTEDAK